MDHIGEITGSGAIIILAMQQMFRYLSSRKNGGVVRCPMEDRIELWQLQISDAVANGITKSLRPLFEVQGETLKTQARSLEKIIDTQNKILLEQVRLDSQRSQHRGDGA